LELLKEVVSKVVHVAVLSESANPGSLRELKEVLPAEARALNLTIQPWEIRAVDDFEKVFAALNKQRPDALYVPGVGPLTPVSAKRIAGFALTVEIVLSCYPVESIRDISISPGLFSRGPWDAKLLTVEGEKLSLNDVEHRILRPIWQDARVHYSVNCASLGCPNLQPMAFTAENTDNLLERGAKEYVNHPRGVAVRNRKLRVSSIYVWFREDFGGNADDLMEHWREYAEGPLAEALQSYSGGLEHDYDWRLNGVEAKP
jgi:hypothetical protein